MAQSVFFHLFIIGFSVSIASEVFIYLFNYVLIFHYSFFHLEFLALPTTSISPSTLNFPNTLFIVDSLTSGHIILISFLVKYPNFPSIDSYLTFTSISWL